MDYRVQGNSTDTDKERIPNMKPLHAFPHWSTGKNSHIIERLRKATDRKSLSFKPPFLEREKTLHDSSSPLGLGGSTCNSFLLGQLLAARTRLTSVFQIQG